MSASVGSEASSGKTQAPNQELTGEAIGLRLRGAITGEVDRCHALHRLPSEHLSHHPVG